MTDFRALCAELLSEIDAGRAAVLNRVTVKLRAALGEPEGGTSVEQVAQIVYENAMLATAPDHAKPHWPSWADLPNSDARIHALNTAGIILARWGRPAASAPSEAAWALAQLLDGVQRHDLHSMTGLSDRDCDRIWAARSDNPTTAPAPKPIPVSERLPEDADCLITRHGSRYCWMGSEVILSGHSRLIWGWRLVPRVTDQQNCPYTYWLPASTRFLPTTVDPGQLT
jgi:hypothetical protein